MEEITDIIINKYFKIYCNICHNKTFKTLPECRMHYKRVHQKKYACYGVCRLCNVHKNQPYRIQEHILFHGQPTGKFQCSICDKSFNYLYYFRKHEKTHNSENDEKQLKSIKKEPLTSYSNDSFTFLDNDDISQEINDNKMNVVEEITKPFDEIDNYQSLYDNKIDKLIELNIEFIETNIKLNAVPKKSNSMKFNLIDINDKSISDNDNDDKRDLDSKDNDELNKLCVQFQEKNESIAITDNQLAAIVDESLKMSDIDNNMVMKYFSLPCDICSNTEFQNINENRLHYQNVHKKLHFCYGICRICDVHKTQPYKIREHILIHMQPSGRFKCTLCDKSFCYLYARRKHEESDHNIQKSFKCNKCKRSFNKKEVLSDHICVPIPMIHDSQSMPYNDDQINDGNIQCDICEKRIAKHSFKRHYREHYTMSLNGSDDANQFQCSICFKSWKFHNQLRIHQKLVHKIDNLYECDKCQRYFFSKKLLLVHFLRPCVSDTNETVTCTSCGKK